MPVLHTTATGAIGGTNVVHAVTGVVLSHDDRANATLRDTAGHIIATLRLDAAGSDAQLFARPVLATGLNVVALAGGATLDIYVE